MKVSNRRKATLSKRTSSVIALCVALVITVALGFLGLNGCKLDKDGEYRLLNWLPTTDAENWPKPISLGLDLRGGMYVEYEATMSDELKAQGLDYDMLL